MPTNGKYTFSCQSDKNTLETFIYNTSHKEATYITQGMGHSSCCCKPEITGPYTRISVILRFSNDVQHQEFELALMNKDAKKALRIIEVMEPLAKGEIMHKPVHRARIFFTNYIAEQEKIQEFNKGYWVQLGLFKKKPLEIPFEIFGNEAHFAQAI